MKRVIAVFLIICLFWSVALSVWAQEGWAEENEEIEFINDEDDSEFSDDEEDYEFSDDEDDFDFFDDDEDVEFDDDDNGFEFIDDDDNGFEFITNDDDGMTSAELTQMLSEAKLGDYVTIGHYPQNDDDPEPIEWIVLKKKDGKVFLLSRYVLDAIPYEESLDKVTWEECTLRAWLNDDFYFDSFTSVERSHIAETKTNEEYDYIYLMNRSEAIEDYLHSSFPIWRRGIPTQRAIDNGVYTEKGNCAWWLRTRGKTNSITWVYGSGKDISSKGNRAHKTSNGVRPCMWVTEEGN